MAKTIDIIIKVLNFGKRLMLTIFAGLFALTAIGAMFSAVADGGFIGVIGSVASAFGAAVCWSIRRD